jgi:cobyrinic acid a,c-diamide synthase
VRIAGVALNRVGSERHRRLAADSIGAIGIPVFGALPRDDKVTLPERHLGLVQAGETSGLDARLDALAEFIERHVDVGAIIAAAAAAALPSPGASFAPRPPAQRIALAHDDAFSFLYPHLAQGWRAAGAEIIFFSPLNDEPPPADCDLCWLPGGYPELHAGRLANASRFLEGLRSFARDRPVHGECGGYMALGRAIVDAAGKRHEMAGLLGLESSFAKRRLHLGYRIATLAANHCLGAKGRTLRGHEFHYASILSEEGDAFAYVSDAYGKDPEPAGLRRALVSGSFFHQIA